MKTTAERQARIDIKKELGEMILDAYECYDVRIGHIFTGASRRLNRKLLTIK